MRKYTILLRRTRKEVKKFNHGHIQWKSLQNTFLNLETKTGETVQKIKNYQKKSIRKNPKYKQRHIDTGSEEDYIIYKETLNQVTAEIRN